MSTTSPTKTTPSSHDAPVARLNEGTAPKDARAREHARHRTKERQEHAVAKERREKATVVRTLGLKMSRGASKLVRKLSMESWDGDAPVEGQNRNRGQDGPALAPISIDRTPAHPGEERVEDTECDMAPARESSNSFTELTLGDVISRPRRPKVKQFDFEMVPPIRTVIALDDAEAEIEEPWEYITRASLKDGSAWKGKSYAQAVANAM